MLDTSIKVTTDNFDGPLALLLTLIRRQEMDIRQLDITVITEQYLDYLSRIKKLDLDIAGDYLYFAATLLLIKSRSCFLEKEPEDEIEDNPVDITSEEELVKRLELLAHFRKMGETLWELPKKGHEIFVRPKPPRKQVLDSLNLPGDLQRLTQSYIASLKKENRKFAMAKKDKISLKEKLIELKDVLEKEKSTNFQQILDKSKDPSRENLVVTFIALLELARLRKINIFQNERRGYIYVDVIESLQNLDVNIVEHLKNMDNALSNAQ